MAFSLGTIDQANALLHENLAWKCTWVSKLVIRYSVYLVGTSIINLVRSRHVPSIY